MMIRLVLFRLFYFYVIEIFVVCIKKAFLKVWLIVSFWSSMRLVLMLFIFIRIMLNIFIFSMRGMKLMIFFNEFFFDLFWFVKSFTFLEWFDNWIFYKKRAVLWKLRTLIDWGLRKLRIWMIKFKLSFLKFNTWLVMMMILKSNVLSLQDVNILFFTVFFHLNYFIGFVFFIWSHRL